MSSSEPRFLTGDTRLRVRAVRLADSERARSLSPAARKAECAAYSLVATAVSFGMHGPYPRAIVTDERLR